MAAQGKKCAAHSHKAASSTSKSLKFTIPAHSDTTKPKVTPIESADTPTLDLESYYWNFSDLPDNIILSLDSGTPEEDANKHKNHNCDSHIWWCSWTHTWNHCLFRCHVQTRDFIQAIGVCTKILCNRAWIRRGLGWFVWGGGRIAKEEKDHNICWDHCSWQCTFWVDQLWYPANMWFISTCTPYVSTWRMAKVESDLVAGGKLKMKKKLMLMDLDNNDGAQFSIYVIPSHTQHHGMISLISWDITFVLSTPLILTKICVVFKSKK